jgi:ribonuclease HI
MPLFSTPLSTAPDWVFAHCDGGSRGNPGPSGFGAVITDAAGQPLAELSEYLGIRTNNFAEYSGLLAVLAWALENGRRRVKVVSDSELMVKQIQGKYKVNSPDLKPLWQTATDRIAKLDAFEITHALRHKNKEADALANRAMDRGMRRTVDRPISAERPIKIAAPPSATAPSPTGLGSSAPIEPIEPRARTAAPTMLRGFVKNGTIQILGGATLPDGIFVKIIRE